MKIKILMKFRSMLRREEKTVTSRTERMKITKILHRVRTYIVKYQKLIKKQQKPKPNCPRENGFCVKSNGHD
jgi:hypothetical protein